MDKENPQIQTPQEQPDTSLELELRWAERQTRDLKFGQSNNGDIVNVTARLPHANLLLDVVSLLEGEGCARDEIAREYRRGVTEIKEYSTQAPQKSGDRALAFSRRLARLAAEGEIYRDNYLDVEVDFFIEKIKPILNFTLSEKTKDLTQNLNF